MGGKGSKQKKPTREEAQLNDHVEKLQEQHRREDSSIKKLLLLGAGESGKSTLFKQMVTLYGSGYSDEDRKMMGKNVFINTVNAMKALVINAERFEQVSEGRTKVAPECAQAASTLQELPSDTRWDPELISILKRLWSDPGIQFTWNKYSSKFQVIDSAQYLFERIDAIADPDYIPSQQDILRIRVRTTGIVETDFEIDGRKFKMIDVGGQRNERKKWIHCFENVTAMIFVSAISAYDQTLFEDETQNRMVESLKLFEEICNAEWFRDTSIILFLNKKDLFEKKINAGISLAPAFPDFDVDDLPTDYEDACDFITEQFENRNRSEDKKIYPHVTCATDTTNVAHVFNSVKDIVITRSLKAGGLF